MGMRGSDDGGRDRVVAGARDKRTNAHVIERIGDDLERELANDWRCLATAGCGASPHAAAESSELRRRTAAAAKECDGGSGRNLLLSTRACLHLQPAPMRAIRLFAFSSMEAPSRVWSTRCLPAFFRHTTPALSTTAFQGPRQTRLSAGLGVGSLEQQFPTSLMPSFTSKITLQKSEGGSERIAPRGCVSWSS